MRSMCLMLFLALLVSAGGIASIQRTSNAQSDDAPGAYIALGDSIAFGIGSSLTDRRSYPALVHDYLETMNSADVLLANLAVPGETAASFLADGQFDAFVDEVASLETAGIPLDVVTVSLGGNEMLDEQYSGTEERQAALDAFRENLDRAVADIRDEIGPDTRIVLTTYYDLSEGDASLQLTDAWWVEQFNTVIRQTAEREGAAVANLSDAFRGLIDEYTYHPYDVHPNNQGYRAIARQVWRAIGLDQEPPAIEVVSGSEVSRRTPTLQLIITDNVDVAGVSVTVNNGPALSPVDLGDGRYVLLLDLRSGDDGEYPMIIEAVDSAGNVNQIEHRIVMQAD